MSKFVKDLITRDYCEKLEGVEDALVVSIRGIDANTNNELRLGLLEKDIRITVMSNTLAKRAFEDSKLEGLGPVMKGPTALAYGAESVIDVARELVDWAKKVEKLELKGAILDGQLFEGDAGVRELSRYPTREEAQAQAVTLILSPGGKLVSSVKGPGSTIASLVKSIEEKLEKNETIAKVG
ncbi:MAG: 50S ribosomal protein L10 [Planctomycetota bacterium]|jgi:large subunit ribosomal protein L10